MRKILCYYYYICEINTFMLLLGIFKTMFANNVFIIILCLVYFWFFSVFFFLHVFCGGFQYFVVFGFFTPFTICVAILLKFWFYFETSLFHFSWFSSSWMCFTRMLDNHNKPITSEDKLCGISKNHLYLEIYNVYCRWKVNMTMYSTSQTVFSYPKTENNNLGYNRRS